MPRRGNIRAGLVVSVLLAVLLLVTGPGLALFWGGETARAGNSPAWEAWSSETFSLAPLESFQMRVKFSDIPVRRWKLVVDGGDQKCDLTLLRAAGEELLYFKTSESLHEYSVPWGKDEELMVVLTNTGNPAAFVVSFFGPPKDQVTAAYSYHVNRALEAYATGQRLEAEDQCRLAIKQDLDDGVAKVLFAGFQRDRNFYDNAAALVDEALAGELPDEMRTLAENMQAELVKLQAPLPAAIRKGLAEAEGLIGNGQPEKALEVCDKLLKVGHGLDGPSQSRILVIKGQALEATGRNYEAVDAYTYALSYDRSRDMQAVIHYHMGRLFYAMDNLAQAQGALAISLQHGLPSGLDVQARELLQATEKRLATER